jgi:hypothetical protein
VASPTVVASILTLVPAMALIYWVLRRYDGYFEQNRLFFGLSAGLFAGIIVKYAEVTLFPFDNVRSIQPEGPITTGTLVYSAAYTAFGFALVASLAMSAVLGFRKFRTRKDTPYYGVALGLAFGAMHTMPLFARSILGLVTPTLRLDPAALVGYAIVILFATGLIMAHGAAAVWVGKGSAEGRLWRGVMQGGVLLSPALAISWFWVQNNAQPGLFPAVTSAAYGTFLTVLASRKVLDPIVPLEIRDQVRRERRRAQRKGEA